MNKLKTSYTRAVENDRLFSLIEFAQQTALLRLNPITDVAKHGVFHEFEHSLQGLPGIHQNSGVDEDEIWFVIDRLHESPAPPKKLSFCKFG